MSRIDYSRADVERGENFVNAASTIAANTRQMHIRDQIFHIRLFNYSSVKKTKKSQVYPGYSLKLKWRNFMKT